MKMLRVLCLFSIVLCGCNKEVALRTLPLNTQMTSVDTITKIVAPAIIIKQAISAEAWKNNANVNDWSFDKQIWFDIDLDGQPDKLSFSTPNSNSFLLKLFLYKGNTLVNTINIADIVRNNALNTFVKDSLLVRPGIGAGRIVVTDYNNDSIPDIIFSIMKQEDQVNIFQNASYQCILISKGKLEYELKVIPIWFRCGDQDVYADFNGDGKTDFFTPNSVHSDIYYPGIANSQIMLNYIDTAFKFKSIAKGNGNFQGVADINDFDNNGISDIVIGEIDYGFNVYGSLGGLHHTGTGPIIHMNYRNGTASNTILLRNSIFSSQWQSFGRFNMTESFAFADLNDDGYKDIILTKSHDTYNIHTAGTIDTLRGERLYEVFINQNGNGFIDKTEDYFPNNTNYIKIPHPTFANEIIPSNPKLIDVDGDGKIDMCFNTYTMYFKNINNQFVLVTNPNGFKFISNSYKTAESY
jgi:hypothetical protein